MKILVTTDFSEESERAFVFLRSFAENLKDKPDVYILHCIERISDSRFYHGLGIDVENIILNCEEESQKKMEELKKNFFDGNSNVKTEIKHSLKSVQAEVVKYCDDNDFDLLLISRKGHTALKNVFFGSISEYVIRHVSCPVLVVPDNN